jgi:hypothetical protein
MKSETALLLGISLAVLFFVAATTTGLFLLIQPEIQPGPLNEFELGACVSRGDESGSGSFFEHAASIGCPIGTTCGDLICNFGETQDSCSTDCTTIAIVCKLGEPGCDITIAIDPPTLTPGETARVTIDFTDSRYSAGGSVKFDLLIQPDGIFWISSNGCSLGGVILPPSSWPAGTISENGHFRISFLCDMPLTITPGQKTLTAFPTIFP